MVRPLALLVLTGLVLAGCATAPPLSHSPSGLSDSTTIPGYGWSYGDDPSEGVKLTYGAARSDEVLLMMLCAPGSRQIQLTAQADQTRGAILLASGAARDSFPARPQADSPEPGRFVEAVAPAGARSLTGFAGTGALTLTAPDRAIRLDATSTDRPMLGQFFDRCGKSRP